MVKHSVKSKKRGPGRPPKSHHKKTHHKTHHKKTHDKTHHKKSHSRPGRPGRPRKECRSTKLKKRCGKGKKSHCAWRKGTGCVRRPKRNSKSKSKSKSRK
jgi:hypothetical protein